MFSLRVRHRIPARTAKLHFFEIKHDEDLTEADKKHLKDFYLQNMIAPRARKIVEQHLAHEMQKDRVHHRMTPADRRCRDAMRNSPPNPNAPRPASPDRTNEGR
jgi:hypothetical protein